MVTKTIDIGAREISIQELLALLETDSEVVLTEGDTPLARLTPLKQAAHPRPARGRNHHERGLR